MNKKSNKRNYIHIKNMVCPRCINSVRNTMIATNIPYNIIQLGEVELVNPLSKSQKTVLSEKLQLLGFELLNDSESELINTIKTYIVEKIHYEKHNTNTNISDALAKHLHKDYSALSRLFSKVEGMTIEKYILHQKVEKIKELLSYDEKNISEIAFDMNYSSSAHLSNQFKKVTGMTPSQFKKLKTNTRKSLNHI